MVTFFSKREATAFAGKRRKGFRKLIKKEQKSKDVDTRRVKFLRAEIKGVKVKRRKPLPRPGGKGKPTPVFEVIGG